MHPRLLAAPHTVLLPHIGSASEATRRRMAQLACEGVVAVLAGERPPNLVTHGRDAATWTSARCGASSASRPMPISRPVATSTIDNAMPTITQKKASSPGTCRPPRLRPRQREDHEDRGEHADAGEQEAATSSASSDDAVAAHAQDRVQLPRQQEEHEQADDRRADHDARDRDRPR